MVQPHLLQTWICQENISRFRSLLARPLSASDRLVLAVLLEEEQQRLDHILKTDQDGAPALAQTPPADTPSGAS